MDCGTLESGYGPYDYTNPEHFQEKLPVVEKGHFSTEVENLVRGKSMVDPMGDIAYTLNRFPNHHRALWAMARYMLRSERRPVPGSRNSPECWFERASRFKPDDGVPIMIHGIYEHRLGRLQNSLDRYQEALVLMPDSGELHYNMGLLYFDMNEYERSADHARRAYDAGYPLLGLQNKLRSAGVAMSSTE
jgi:tetratricopeptide (TPR) repeat protein